MPRTPDPLAAAETAARLLEASATPRHDVRNKLSAIKNAAFYLRRKSEKLPIWSEDTRFPIFFGLIESELAATEPLLAEMPGPVTLFAPRLNMIDPVACVERAWDLARVDAALQLEHRYEPIGARLHADADEVAMAVRGLLENAAEASPPGGVISVHTSLVGNLVQIDITDQGTPLTADQQAAAMRPFFTTRPGHAGLGLPIALRVARRRRGTLTFLESNPWTSVRMTLALDGVHQGARA